MVCHRASAVQMNFVGCPEPIASPMFALSGKLCQFVCASTCQDLPNYPNSGECSADVEQLLKHAICSVCQHLHIVSDFTGCAANSADTFSMNEANSPSTTSVNSNMAIGRMSLVQVQGHDMDSWQQQACSTSTPSLADKQQVNSLHVLQETELMRHDWSCATLLHCMFDVCLCTSDKDLGMNLLQSLFVQAAQSIYYIKLFVNCL